MRFVSSLRLARLAVCGVLALSLAALGCGSSAGTISGKVYYKGTALKGGTVAFLGANNQSQTAEIQEDGSYKAEKVPVGDATICVETDSFKPPSAMRRQYTAPADASSDYKPPDFSVRAKRYVRIPERYNDPDKSGLKFAVSGGSQEHDIKLD